MGVTRVFWCPTVSGTIMSLVDEWWGEWYGTGLALSAVSYSSHLGFPSVSFTVEPGPDEIVYIFVANGSGVGEPSDARSVVSQAGFAVEMSANYGVTHAYDTWEPIRAQWMAVLVPIIAAAIDHLTNGSTGEVSFYEIEAAGGTTKYIRAVIPIFTDAEIVIFQCSIIGLRYASDSVYQFSTGRAAASPGSAPAQEGLTEALSRIAEAINLIAKTSRVTWINNQGGFADIATGDIVAPGGGGD